MLTSLEDLWKALEPFAENVGDGLLWFWETVLVPLGTWVLNEAVPSFLDLVAAGVEAADGALDAAKEGASVVLGEFLTTPGFLDRRGGPGGLTDIDRPIADVGRLVQYTWGRNPGNSGGARHGFCRLERWVDLLNKCKILLLR